MCEALIHNFPREPPFPRERGRQTLVSLHAFISAQARASQAGQEGKEGQGRGRGGRTKLGSREGAGQVQLVGTAPSLLGTGRPAVGAGRRQPGGPPGTRLPGVGASGGGPHLSQSTRPAQRGELAYQVQVVRRCGRPLQWPLPALWAPRQQLR